MDITVNIHEAKTHLSRLVEQAAKGQEFVIAKAGKPMVRVVPITAPSPTRVLGFLAGQGSITADLKTAFADDIDSMFSAGQ
ncbi:MAG: type II toxin-antitoxin system Phd/YefM family antitoxin [Burkholderiaceae bacterium]|jgi:prevent-host-death family protein|nr:type II toxin-antitoxin system Phd/YefM family antitoxin [Burkholderiaceae bacterium]